MLAVFFNVAFLREHCRQGLPGEIVTRAKFANSGQVGGRVPPSAKVREDLASEPEEIGILRLAPTREHVCRLSQTRQRVSLQTPCFRWFGLRDKNAAQGTESPRNRNVHSH